jgi:outer membrane protein TolC
MHADSAWPGEEQDHELLMLWYRLSWWCLAIGLVIGGSANANAQSAPAAPERPWTSPFEQQIQSQNQSLPTPKFTIDPNKAYSLPELVDLAEQHNPETRFAWERAKAQAAALGIAKSQSYPVLGALAAAEVGRDALLINTNFLRQTTTEEDLALTLNYTILDFGRGPRIQEAAAQLLATDFGFNDSHRKVIYQVEQAYYRVLSTTAQQQAAEANLANAQAVQAAAQDRLANGLATRPDVLEAQSATAQAQFDLQSAIGTKETARGDLAAAIGTSASVAIAIEPISSITTPETMEDSAEQLIDRALQQRPDLLQQVANLRAQEAAVKEAHAAYYPKLTVSAIAGQQYLYGFQEQIPATQTSLFDGSAAASLTWTILDGGARRSAVAQAEANTHAATAQINSTRNQIADEVWRAYSNVKTAFRQRQAAASLLESAQESYNAALEAYNYGVRNLLDVTNAQRVLAQARSTDISARTQVLTTLAELAFRTGDLLRTNAKPGKP